MNIIKLENRLIIGSNLKAFNPAIFEKNEKFYIIFRFEAPPAIGTKLGIVELNDSLTPIYNTLKVLNISSVSEKIIAIEDPRTFYWDDNLYVINSQASLVEGGDWCWCNSQVITQLNNNFEAEKNILLDYGKNINLSNYGMFKGNEKNWIPFVDNKKLKIIYNIHPLEIFEVYCDSDEDQYKTRPVEAIQEIYGWDDYGIPSGGTNLIRRGDEFWGVFHSHIPNDDHFRDYFMGFYAISANEPHKVTRISKQPIMCADWNPRSDLRKIGQEWTPNAIFPCGLIEKGGKAYISYGWQDCRCKILETSYEELNATAKLL